MEVIRKSRSSLWGVQITVGCVDMLVRSEFHHSDLAYNEHFSRLQKQFLGMGRRIPVLPSKVCQTLF